MALRFEHVSVGWKAVEFSQHVCRMARSFPMDAPLGLTSQLRRTAVSTSSIIATSNRRSSIADVEALVALADMPVAAVASQAPGSIDNRLFLRSHPRRGLKLPLNSHACSADCDLA
ncbi:MAG: four helix bundle protein [Planctomycetaceae bacterium]|nr:four helix bundle protein [Planctomycetaceae bacterium]